MGSPSILHIATLDLSVRFLLLDFLLYLKKRGYQVASMSAPGPWVGEIEAAGIRHIPLSIHRSILPWRDLATLVTLVRILRQERFDVVHTHTPKSLILGEISSGLAKVRCSVATVHGFYFHDRMRWLKRQFFVNLYRCALANADLVFSQSMEDMVTAEREKICLPQKLVFIGNGTDIDRFSPSARDRLRVSTRAALGISPDCFVIGTVGRLTYEKGYSELLEAAKSVIHRHPEVLFLVIGPDYVLSRETLKARAAQMGLQSHFRFLGLRTDIAEMYSMMDLFVLPSYREGMPRSLIEACAMGLPVVATNIRGCREIVTDGLHGRLIPPRDAPALARALNEMLDAPDERTRLGVAARKRAAEQFDIRRVWAIQEEHYRRALGV